MPGDIGAQARRAVTLVAAAIIAIVMVCASTATAEPGSSPGYYDFHPYDTQYKYVGKHGTFTGDVIYSGSGLAGNRLLWSLRLSPYVQGFVHGTMSCGASVSGKPRYHDLHPSVPADYWWHSAVTDLQLDTLYKFYARCDFTATNGQVTSPGSVEYRVQFMLRSR